MMKGKWWIIPAAVLAIAVAIFLYTGGVFVDRDAAPPPGNNDIEQNGPEEPVPEPGEEPGEPAEDNRGGNDAPAEDGPGDTTWAKIMRELERCKNDLDSIYFQLNHILDRYDRMELSGAEAAAGLAQLSGDLEQLERSFRVIEVSAYTEAEQVRADFKRGVELTAGAVTAMTDYLKTGDPASFNLFQDKVRAADHYFLQGEAGLEKLKREAGS